MKIIALHLPQFHEIDENNLWWGKGFTEWTNIKRPNKFSYGQKPFNDNYYDLLDKETMQWQCTLSQKHGIYGFCYYHYWFQGKKLLEKPVENLLEWKDIPQRFCLQWANHSWKKTWNGTSDVLIQQTYGSVGDWEKHFDYLKDFFLDDRYIKVDNRPLFLIFNNKFNEIDDIIDFFDKSCKKIGFDGIYFVEGVTCDNMVLKIDSKSNGIFIREPASSIVINRNFFLRSIWKIKRILQKYFRSSKLIITKNGRSLRTCNIKTAKELVCNKPYYLGAFAMWDNTYRHNERGFKISPPTKSEFLEYLQTLKQIGEEKNIEFMFYNAWNEWCEGMVLEPDTLNGTMLLDCMKEVFGNQEGCSYQ